MIPSQVPGSKGELWESVSLAGGVAYHLAGFDSLNYGEVKHGAPDVELHFLAILTFGCATLG